LGNDDAVVVMMTMKYSEKEVEAICKFKNRDARSNCLFLIFLY